MALVIELHQSPNISIFGKFGMNGRGIHPRAEILEILIRHQSAKNGELYLIIQTFFKHFELFFFSQNSILCPIEGAFRSAYSAVPPSSED